MLEQFGNRFRGVVLGMMILLLSAVFILQFGGPQAEGCTQGAQGAVAEVYGRQILPSELKAALTMAGADTYPTEMAEQSKVEQMVLYGLIERNLLARQAREIGFNIEDDAILGKIAEDGILHMSMSVEAGASLPRSGPQKFDFKDKSGKFSKDNLRNFIQYRLRRSLREFTRSQVEETLAQRMREAVTANVIVAPGELWDAYVREKESAQLDYVRFSKAYFEQRVKPTAADLDAFLAANAKDVDAEYEANKARYTGLEKQVRARHILVKVESGASEEEKAGKRAEAEKLLAQAKKPGADFAALAAANSEDTGSAKQGGDLGFNPKGRMVTEFDDAQFALAPGQISELVETTFGFHIIKVEAVREGDVPVAEAKRELGEKLLVQRKSQELAQAAANALLEKVKAGATIEDALAATQGAVPEAERDPLAPELRQTRAFGRTDSAIPGPFDSSALVQAAYEMKDVGTVGSAPMQLGDDWFVYRLAARTNAEKEAFTAEEQERLQNALVRRKQSEVLTSYVRELLARAQADEAVLIDTAVLEGQRAEPQS